MSRRHKEYPSITRQEVEKIAEETSKRVVDSVFGEDGEGASFLDFKCSVLIQKKLTRRVSTDLTHRLTEVGITIADTPGLDVKVYHGRSIVDELFERFRNTDVIEILKEIYHDVYHRAIEEARDINEHLIAYFLAMCMHEHADPYGLVAAYYRLVTRELPHAMLKTCRTFQNRVRDFVEYKATSVCSRIKQYQHAVQLELRQMYLEHIARLAPEYAIY